MIICKRSVDLDDYLHLFGCCFLLFAVGQCLVLVVGHCFFCCLSLFADPDDHLHLSLVVVCHCLSLVIVCLLSLSVVCRL